MSEATASAIARDARIARAAWSGSIAGAPRQLDHVTVATSDVDAFVQWYVDTLGFRFMARTVLDEAIAYADYFGLFCEAMKSRLAPGQPGNKPPFVGIMSHGCSGDIWRRDYRKPAPKPGEEPTIEGYANQLADIASAACGISSRLP